MTQGFRFKLFGKYWKVYNYVRLPLSPAPFHWPLLFAQLEKPDFRISDWHWFMSGVHHATLVLTPKNGSMKIVGAPNNSRYLVLNRIGHHVSHAALTGGRAGGASISGAGGNSYWHFTLTPLTWDLGPENWALQWVEFTQMFIQLDQLEWWTFGPASRHLLKRLRRRKRRWRCLPDQHPEIKGNMRSNLKYSDWYLKRPSCLQEYPPSISIAARLGQIQILTWKINDKVCGIATFTWALHWPLLYSQLEKPAFRISDRHCLAHHLLVSTMARMFWPTATKVVGAPPMVKDPWPTDDTITPTVYLVIDWISTWHIQGGVPACPTLTGGRTGEASQRHSTGLTLYHVCLWPSSVQHVAHLNWLNRIWNGTMEWFEFIATFVQGKELGFHRSMAGFKGKSTGKLVLSGVQP